MPDSPIKCRMCGKRMGTVRRFEGKIFSLCIKCEEIRKQRKKRREL